MFILLCVVMVLAGILLVAAVLLQPGKGAGLSGFGGATGQISNMFGARRTSDFLQKFTIGLALGILLLAVITNKFFLSTPTSATGTGDDRTPITQGVAKPPAQPAPQMQQQSPQGQAPAQGQAPQGQQQAQPTGK